MKNRFVSLNDVLFVRGGLVMPILKRVFVELNVGGIGTVRAVNPLFKKQDWDGGGACPLRASGKLVNWSFLLSNRRIYHFLTKNSRTFIKKLGCLCQDTNG